MLFLFLDQSKVIAVTIFLKKKYKLPNDLVTVLVGSLSTEMVSNNSSKSKPYWLMQNISEKIPY